MSSYNELLALIDAYINQNGVQAITGQVLNGVLRAMVDQLGRGYAIMGAALPNTDPGTPDAPESWFASTPGTYTNFDGLTVANAELALLSYSPTDQAWTKQTLTQGIVSTSASVDNNVGTPSVTSSYVNGVLTFTFQNLKGNPGQDGDAAGFGTVSATVDGNVGTPGVSVQTSGPNTAKNMVFQFTNLKGETGVTSVVATVDNTSGSPQCAVSLSGGVLTLAFTGLKGAQGDTGSSVAYPFTIVNNLTTNDATQALSAAMGVQLESEVTQLEHDLSDSLSAKFFSIGIINANCSWCSLGTSITWYNDNVNSSFTKGYQTRVREKVYFSSFTNKGINGGTMGSGNGVTGLGDSLSTIVSADLYTIEHGVNDWGHSVPIGTIDDYKNDTGTNTFFGAYRKVIDKIYQLNINAKIILCTPRKAYGFNGYLPLSWDAAKNGLYLKQYADAVLSIAEYESLPVCDWFNESGANQKTLDNYSIDTALHPNDAGYQMMADLLINTMRNMFNSDKMDCVYEAGENVVRVEPTLASGGTAYNNKNGTFIGPEMGVNKQTTLSKILSSVDKTGVKVGICVVNPNNTPNVVSVYRYVTLSGTETDVLSLGIVVPAGCYVGFSNEIAQNPASSFSFVANSGTPHFQMYDDSVFQPSQFQTLKMTLGYELVY